MNQRAVQLRASCLQVCHRPEGRANQVKPTLLSAFQLSHGSSHCPSPNRSHLSSGTAPTGFWTQAPRRCVGTSGTSSTCAPGRDAAPATAALFSQRPPSWPGFSPSRRHLGIQQHCYSCCALGSRMKDLYTQLLCFDTPKTAQWLGHFVTSMWLIHPPSMIGLQPFMIKSHIVLLQSK